MLENQPGSLIDVTGAVVSALDEYNHSYAQSMTAKILDGTGAAEISILVGANPITAIPDAAINFLGDTGIVPDADKYSISGTLNSSVDIATTETEALLTGDTNELMDLEQGLQAGKRGKLFQWAAEAGEYWDEHGLVDGLAQGDEGAEIAIKDLGRSALESVENAASKIFQSNDSGEDQ